MSRYTGIMHSRLWRNAYLCHSESRLYRRRPD